MIRPILRLQPKQGQIQPKLGRCWKRLRRPLEEFLAYRCLTNKEGKTSGKNVKFKRLMTGSNVKRELVRACGKNERRPNSQENLNEQASREKKQRSTKKRWQEELG